MDANTTSNSAKLTILPNLKVIHLIQHVYVRYNLRMTDFQSMIDLFNRVLRRISYISAI